MAGRPSADVVRAAGGILRRSTNGSVQIAVVHRKRHGGDWTLPKGHLHADETWEKAAVREVREETGCEGRVVGATEPIAYLVDGVPKLVLFFEMELVMEGQRRRDDEVADVAWLSPIDATKRLTYHREAELVARQFPSPAPNPFERKTTRPGVRAERLRATLNVEEKLIRARIDRAPNIVDADTGIDWASKTSELLEQARSSLVTNRIEEGWRSLNAARRLSIFGMPPDERALEGVRLLEEAKVKLDSWRSKTVERVLSTADGDLRSPPEPVKLHFVRQLLDDHFDTIYLRLDLLQRRLVQLPVLLSVVLAGLFSLVIFDVPAAGSESVLGSWRRFVTIVVLGTLGAIISVTLAGLRNPLRGRITEIMQRDAITLLRPLVGATSAVAVAIVLESGIQTAVDVRGARVFPFALAAGFTERLITRVMRSVEDAAAAG